MLPYQTAVGVADILIYTMARYFSNDMEMDLTHSIVEALLRTMIENAYKEKANPNENRARVQIMWGGSLAHNGQTECGLKRDWACQ